MEDRRNGLDRPYNRGLLTRINRAGQMGARRKWRRLYAALLYCLLPKINAHGRMHMREGLAAEKRGAGMLRAGVGSVDVGERAAWSFPLLAQRPRKIH